MVRSSGYLEQTAFELSRDYVANRSGGPVRAFAHSWLGTTRNPSPPNLEDLVGRFDAGWRDEFTELLKEDDERLERELWFLVRTRHRIAHGHNESINASKALQLKDVATDLADWLIRRFAR